jgi:hypothetical protein
VPLRRCRGPRACVIHPSAGALRPKSHSGARRPPVPPSAPRRARPQELSLARCKGLRCAPALAGLCAAPLPSLRRLDLSRVHLRPSALAAAVRKAPWCAALASLDLRNFEECFYSARDMARIRAALRKPPLKGLAAGGRLRQDFSEECETDSCSCGDSVGCERCAGMVDRHGDPRPDAPSRDLWNWANGWDD